MEPVSQPALLRLLRAPIGSDLEREHFQRRLSLALLLVFSLAFGFWLITVGVHPFIGHGSIRVLFFERVSIAQLSTTFSALAIGLLLRARRWSVDFLDGSDVIGTLALCWGWSFMATAGIPGRRPEMVGILAVTYTLVIRTALLPSRTLRTAVIGVGGFLPLILGTHALYARELPDALASAPLSPAVYAAIWAALAVACTGAISFVIHDLRLQVSRARQLGQYLLEQQIGEGAMGTVYRAKHSMLRRPTAIKLLTGTTGHAVTRFEREVQLTAQLTHPNTIAIYDYGRTPEGTFYYAMEYLDGITLDELVRIYGPQPPARVVHLLLQICGALEEAHAAGLVHRDIKPANVMLTERGGHKDTVKVLDFGLVKESTSAKQMMITSSTNAVMGTPHFMAPEAILDPPSVDARTDLYSLGVTGYYLLTGERVFEGANLVEICSAHLHLEPPRPQVEGADIPEALCDVILCCLAKKPEGRPSCANELAARLLACDLPPWTRADADAWWDSAGAPSVVAPAKRRRKTAMRAGATMDVALEDRSRT